MSRILRNNLFWVAAYLVSLIVVIVVLVRVRSSRLEAWSRPETQARWREFQAGERKRWDDATSPVRRRPAKGDASADVILLRDHFGAVAIGIVATGTFLFCFVAVLARGSLVNESAATNHDIA
jgi:hypothetical protein